MTAWNFVDCLTLPPYLTPNQRVEAIAPEHICVTSGNFSINWTCSICVIIVAVMFAYWYPDIFWCRVRMASSTTLLSHRGPALLGEETSDCDINDY